MRVLKYDWGELIRKDPLVVTKWVRSVTCAVAAAYNAKQIKLLKLLQSLTICFAP